MQVGPIEHPSIAEVVGGGEATHFNAACATEIDRIIGPVIGVDVEDVQREVPCGARRLDLLATAVGRRVAIELQYGEADPDHLGRLIGWYAPHVSATDHVLVAEAFPASVVDGVRTGRIPNMALVRVVTGWNPDGSMGLDFEVVESNIERLRGSSEDARARADRARKSIKMLAAALSDRGLKDSNARDYVRLFPVQNRCWAVAEIRASRVVVAVGSFDVFDSELAAENLGDEWIAKGNRIYNEVFDGVESFVLTRDQANEVASRIEGQSEAIEESVKHVATTIRRPAEDEL